MKDLILNFSWDRLLNLPPSDFLAVVVLAWAAVYLGCNWIIRVIQIIRAK